MEIIENLEKLNFSKLEAQIYMALLGEAPMSAYQLAKKIDISRPSIYNALDHMVDKGMVEIVPNETLLYSAQEPDVILEKIESEIRHSLHEAKAELKAYRECKYDEVYMNFRGYDTLIAKSKEILRRAERDIYINTDFEIPCLKEELQRLIQKKIRVIIFSFYELEEKVEGVDYFSHGRKMDALHEASRFELAVDGQLALAADGNSPAGIWRGIVSSNKLFVRIISEHIHNDIYILKLRDKYGKEIYGEDFYLNTEFEQRNKLGTGEKRRN